MKMRCIVRMYVYRKLPSAEVGSVTVWGLARVWNTGRKQNGALKQCCRSESGTAMRSRWAILHIYTPYLYVYLYIYQLHMQRALEMVLLQREV